MSHNPADVKATCDVIRAHVKKKRTAAKARRAKIKAKAAAKAALSTPRG